MEFRSGDKDAAGKTWNDALAIDSALTMNPAYDASDVGAAWEDARASAGLPAGPVSSKPPPGGAAAAPVPTTPPAGATHPPAPEPAPPQHPAPAGPPPGPLPDQPTAAISTTTPRLSRRKTPRCRFTPSTSETRSSTRSSSSTRARNSGVNVSIQFSSSDGDDTTSSFSLQSCGTVNGTYTDVAPAATFTQNLSTGTFQTVYPKNRNIQFYRLRHN